MTDFDKNAAEYLEQTRLQLERKQKLSKYVEIPFLSISNSAEQVFLNPALDASAIDPRKATEADYATAPLLRVDAVITADGVKDEMIRRPAGRNSCFIDWISITMQSDTFDNAKTTSQVLGHFRQSAIIENAADVLKDIFGFGIEGENKTGRNFYERSFTLEHNAGFICIGGQNDTVMISINGTGCTYGKDGWEEHLHAWLNLFAREFKITRVDLAHDDLYGEYTDIDWFNNQHTIGGFTRGGRPPSVEWRGDWKKPNGKGRTLYIGSRHSAQLCRIYEKGKQLGDPNSKWLRTEVQYSSRGMLIGSDVLIAPNEFFSVTYPCFSIFEFEGETKKFERIDKQDLMTWQQAIDLVKTQYGRYLYFFRDVFDDDTALLDVLTDIKNTAVPERIDALTIPKLSHQAGVNTMQDKIELNGITYDVDELTERTLVVYGAQPTDYEKWKFIDVIVQLRNKKTDAGGYAQTIYRYADLADIHKFHEHQYPYKLKVKMASTVDKKGNELNEIVWADFANATELELVDRKPPMANKPLNVGAK